MYSVHVPISQHAVPFPQKRSRESIKRPMARKSFTSLLHLLLLIYMNCQDVKMTTTMWERFNILIFPDSGLCNDLELLGNGTPSKMQWYSVPFQHQNIKKPWNFWNMHNLQVTARASIPRFLELPNPWIQTRRGTCGIHRKTSNFRNMWIVGVELLLWRCHHTTSCKMYAWFAFIWPFIFFGHDCHDCQRLPREPKNPSMILAESPSRRSCCKGFLELFAWNLDSK